MINKNIKNAAALSYQNAQGQPGIVPRGTGTTAERIIAEAIENNIPIEENIEFLQQITNKDFFSEIPFELYPVVNEIIDYIFALDDKINDENNQLGVINA